MSSFPAVCRQAGYACLIALCMASASHAQTAEQLRQLENLTPAQRAAIIEALGGQPPVREQAVSEPAVVIPRRSEQPVYESTDIGEGMVADAGSATADPAQGPRLRPFGYDLFAGEPSTFAPATDIPIPVDYVIGPGDTIEVQLFGGQNAFYSLVVTREGTLNFPEIGPLSVAGLRFGELRQLLQQRVSEQMIGVTASITMGPLRSIRIFVLGDAHRPGSYTVSALSTMTNALFVSGGISEIGSLRKVQLKRSGKLITTLDLYDLLLRGDTSGDARLQPGDVIFIPPVGNTVGVDGEVRRPAIYELQGEATVAQVLAVAGGMLPSSYPQASQIERINAERERTVIDVDLTTQAGLGTSVRADDTIRIYSVLEKREDIVLLEGHVNREGTYQWRPGMRLTDLIPSTEDLLPKADLDYVLIRRERPDGLRTEVRSANLGKALRARGSAADIPLQAKDTVTVFNLSPDRSDLLTSLIDELRLQSRQGSPTQEVTVVGRVRAPGVYPLESGMRVSDLLRAGGQLEEAAYPLEAELTRFSIVGGQFRKASLVKVDLNRVLSGDEQANLVLSPHDVLNVKEMPQWSGVERVEVVGEVRFPGVYPIRRGERLSSLLQRAGGLNDLAFAEGAIFLREELRQREEEQLAELVERLESDVSSLAVSQEEQPEVTSARRALLSQVRNTQAPGRLVIDLPGLIADPTNQDVDVMLRAGDRLLIPKESPTVTVIGEVQFPTSHLFGGELTVQDYIDKSGGTTADADEKRIYVVRADGAVEPSARSKFFRSRNSQTVRPGDTVVVPLEADRISKLSLWTNVTSIIYNIGVAAAAVASF